MGRRVKNRFKNDKGHELLFPSASTSFENVTIPFSDNDDSMQREMCDDQDTTDPGVANGIAQVLETCCRCGRRFENVNGSEEPPIHRNRNLPCCLDCIGLDCVSCGCHTPGKMIRIAGTPYSRCRNCSPPTPSIDTNRPITAPVGAHGRISDRG